MSTVQEITDLQPSSTLDPPVYSPFEAYWKAFQIWRKRRWLQAELSGLTDRELIDIGITRAEIEYVSSKAADATTAPKVDVRYW